VVLLDELQTSADTGFVVGGSESLIALVSVPGLGCGCGVNTNTWDHVCVPGGWLHETTGTHDRPCNTENPSLPLSHKEVTTKSLE